jgi:hypothetical protein
MNKLPIILAVSFLLLGAAPSPGDVLVSYTGEGTSPNDDSDGPAEDMALSDGAQNGTFEATVSTVNTPVKFGSNAYDFLSSTAAITIPSSTSLGTTFTLAAFAWSNSGGGQQAIFAYWDTGVPGASAEFLLDIDPQGSANAMRFIHDTTTISANANFATGGYHHFALTYDNGAVSLYLDGSVVGSGNVGAGSMNLGGDVTVGWSSNNKLAGWMDDILILDRVLTPDEISTHWTGGNSAILNPPADATFMIRTAQFAPGLNMGHVAWGDYNNDGYVDLHEENQLWQNNAGTHFTLVQAGYGRSIWGDYDNDGYLDLFAFPTRAPAKVMRNVSGTGFAVAYTPGLPMGDSFGASWVDHNNDGYLDVYVGGAFGDADAAVANQQASSFVKAWEYAGLYARGVTPCDFDRDGDVDIYVSNYWQVPNLLWLSDGTGGFVEQAAAYGVAGDPNEGVGYGHTIGSAWGDLDNDGNIDLFVGNFNHPDIGRKSEDSKFFRNQGPPNYHFADESATAGLAWQESFASPALGDYDNDGDLDLFLTTVLDIGSFGIENHAVLYRNDGGWNFTDVTTAEGLFGLSIHENYQAAWADIDNDGDLDLVTAGRIYINAGSANHWLKVRLEGDGATVNRAAIGAQVRIDLGGGTVLTRQVEGGTGQGNQNELTLHFGLGSRTAPVDFEVSWPGGTTTMVFGVAVDGLVEVTPEAGVEAGVDNGFGATDVTHNAAWLTGNLLSTPGPNTDVCVLWGPTNEGPTNTWPNQSCISVAGTGPFSIAVSSLDPNTTYYYICKATSAAVEAWSEAATSFVTDGILPFEEPFDTRTPGQLAGQYGWDAAPTGAAVVQASDTHDGGGRAVHLTTGTVWHEFSGPGRTDIVWTDLYAKLVPQPPTVPAGATNAAAIFCVGPESGHLIVYDGSNPIVLTNKPAVAPNTWSRYTVRCNYAEQTWDLWLNTTNMVSNLDFYSGARTEFRRLRLIQGESSSPASLDQIYIGSQRPAGILFIDDDGDGMDDDWEIFYFGSTTNSSGGSLEDWDLDGFIDLWEFRAGTIPIDPTSLLAISNTWTEGESGLVLTWYSVSNKQYAVTGGSNLVGSWSMVATNILATPPLNVETVTVETAPGFYRIELE